MQLIPAVFSDVAGTMKVPVVLVAPAVRKKRAKLPSSEDNEDASKALARRLCPSADLSLKKHVGRAEAILKGKMASVVTDPAPIVILILSVAVCQP
jgi:hypothetical protein